MKTPLRILLAAAITVSLFAGCAPTRPKANGEFQIQPPPRGKAIVYLYRSSRYAYGEKFTVFINRQPVTALTAYGYYPLEVNPGKIEINGAKSDFHAFAVGDELVGNIHWGNKVLLTINAEPGKNYFARLDLKKGTFVIQQNITGVSESQAKAELNGLQLCSRISKR